MNNAKTKRCTRCKTHKPLTEYRLNTSKGRVSLHSWCNQCRAAALRESRVGAKFEDGRHFRGWRPPFGERSHKAKLTDDDVRLIRQLVGITAADAGKKFDVSASTIKGIWRGETWTHVQ